MKTMIKLFSAVVVVFFLTNVYAQDLNETIKSLSESAAKSYVKPVVNGFAADLNGGWFRKAPKAKLFGFDIDIGVVAMAAFFEDADKTFSTSGTFRFNDAQATAMTTSLAGNPARAAVITQIKATDYTVAISGPTVIGSKDEFVKVTFPGATVQGQNVPLQDINLTEVKGLLGDVSLVPLGVPQVGIGTVFGTQGVFRYLPEYDFTDIGKVKYFGWGIQHNPKQWLKVPIPFDICFAYFTQKLEIGTILETNTSAYGINASKQLGGGILNITPYVGYMIEKADMDFSYSYDIDATTTQDIAFSMSGENKNRFTVGLGMKLLFLNINADYNFGKVKSATVGIMLLSF